jgi:hypothetical protein
VQDAQDGGDGGPAEFGDDQDNISEKSDENQPSNKTDSKIQKSGDEHLVSNGDSGIGSNIEFDEDEDDDDDEDDLNESGVQSGLDAMFEAEEEEKEKFYDLTKDL